jgi:hypothetical protein
MIHSSAGIGSPASKLVLLETAHGLSSPPAPPSVAIGGLSPLASLLFSSLVLPLPKILKSLQPHDVYSFSYISWFSDIHERWLVDHPFLRVFFFLALIVLTLLHISEVFLVEHMAHMVFLLLYEVVRCAVPAPSVLLAAEVIHNMIFLSLSEAVLCAVQIPSLLPAGRAIRCTASSCALPLGQRKVRLPPPPPPPPLLLL